MVTKSKLNRILEKCEEVLIKSQNNIILLLALTAALSGIKLFWTGFHNLDSAQNFMFMRDDINMDMLRNNINYTVGVYIETTSIGNHLSFEETYVLGIRQLMKSIPIIIISFLVMGYYFRRLEERKW